MAKRMTDTEKWRKQFFKGLSTVNKLFFLYILDECDNAGVWHVEPEIAEIRIGDKLDIKQAKKELGKHIHEFDNGEKWFIPSFVHFQNGELSETSNPHKSVINKLEHYGLTQVYEGFVKGSGTLRDRAIDKDKDINREIYRKFKHLSVSVNENNKLLKMGYSQNQIDFIYDAIENYAKNKNYTSLYLTARKWLFKEYGEVKSDPDMSNNTHKITEILRKQRGH